MTLYLCYKYFKKNPIHWITLEYDIVRFMESFLWWTAGDINPAFSLQNCLY